MVSEKSKVEAEERPLFTKEEEELVMIELEHLGHQLLLNQRNRKANDVKAFIREMMERVF